ncbi:MAG: pentapeptide repeat-containing protein [Planctomycetota bacterium]|jgi:hypothetical protein|nr:pentapeptide repeat-containing protein [Planctomycetota bacterium]
MPQEQGLKYYLEILDMLVSGLDTLINQDNESPLRVSANDETRRSLCRPVGIVSPTLDRKPRAMDVVFLDDKRLILRSLKSDFVKQMRLEATVMGDRTGKGETNAVILGTVMATRRVPKGYEVEAEISEYRRIHVTPSQKLLESTASNDMAGWNRWCQEITDTIDLVGVSLSGVDLSGYDLCGADLSGADLTGADLRGAALSGADLSQAKLTGAKVSGADLFRATLAESQREVLDKTGMLEKESVVFVKG